MAGALSNKVNMRGRAAAVAVAVLMLAISVGARSVKLKDSSCSTADEYVYPYWSFCNSPAQLATGYHYVSVGASGLGGLEPEYDESNSTYYVRLTGSFSSSGATYVAVDEASGTLLVNSTVYIYNAESMRALQWRQEGSDEYFLIEEEVSSVTEGAPFRFVQAKDTNLPCPLIYPPAQCQAYYLVSDPDSSSGYTDAGLLAYLEEGATYVKAAPAGSTGDLPLLVTKPTSSAMLFPTIRTVTRE